MTYGISETPSELTINLSATTRDELYREAAKAALDAVYGGAPATGATDGQRTVQGAGLTEGDRLQTFVAECFEAARRAPGTLQAPRWLSFDEGRVTANLVLALPKAPVRALEPALHDAFEATGVFPEFRATLAFRFASH